MDAKRLELYGVISFDGITRNGLCMHPDGEHIVYPMGNKVVVKSMKTDEQTFLAGHRNVVSTLCVSPRGNWIASGQTSHSGFKAMTIIWDYAKRAMKTSYEMHKVRVEHVCFTQDERYLISLGGRDDGFIVVWDVENGNPFCGVAADKDTYGTAMLIVRTNVQSSCFITGGNGTFRFWRVDPKNRKIDGSNVKIGKLRRSINCIAVSENDENIYCGTTSGDIIKARLTKPECEECSPIMVGCYSKVPGVGTETDSEPYAGGVMNLLLLRNGERIVVGAGDGRVELVEIPNDLVQSCVGNKTKKLLVLPCIVTLRKAQVCAMVTSMVRYNDKSILVGTSVCEIFEIALSTFKTHLLVTCHNSPIYGLAFPRDRSEIFATGGKHDIRIWKLSSRKELLRITIANFVCTSLTFDSTGGTILSAWNDGAIRAFALNGGHLLYAITSAHVKSVSVVAITHDGCRIVSGGCDGQVRVWNAKSPLRKLLVVLKEHRAAITSLHISPDDKMFISSSRDGTCIMWDIRSFKRKFSFRGSTMYLASCFVPSGVQVLTCGTDRKIAYWETFDGSLVREIEGSPTSTLTAISVSCDGRYFVTGSDDTIVKLWDYRTATTVRLGLAHAAPITSCAFTPDGKYLVTVSADGAIMIWIYPFQVTTEKRSESVLSDRVEEGDASEKQLAVVPCTNDDELQDYECTCEDEEPGEQEAEQRNSNSKD